MIAIPVNNQKLPAGHFSKAPQILIYNPEMDESHCFTNPAASEGCQGKQELIELLKREKVGIVCVRNIGEKMLGRLLDLNLSIHHIQPGTQNAKAIYEEAKKTPQLLTSAEQGRPSINHLRKQQNGGCGCNHKHGSADKKRCCGKGADHSHALASNKGCCCQGKRHA
ncbi:NifB/NifX family molybdenum-iron cluster-binding protein [Dongshaea marina]|uniref:NifB/NifX family molybdenum-iron cluster-binding protein n=1 Tax=Dongshaea marina TaxID=2047966 RepID=UPI00131F2FD6|nr:NifB/NifX family molybdenum-iron cluster-binding protein [Dongshaea marina]